MNKLVATALAALAASSLWAVPGTVKTATDQKSGDIQWQRSSKSYIVTFQKGKASINAEYPLAEVEKLEIEKPANFDKLVAMVSGGQGALAIAPLAEIVKTYRMLQWDKPAGRWLVEAYLAANNAQKAYDTARDIISDDVAAAWTGDLAPAYWQALLKLGKTTQLENCLQKAASSGDRVSSASALVMRGDVILATGDDKPETYRQALIDAYLRVALMYADEPCREIRALAMRKAAECFEKLGMAARAEGMRAQAKTL